jgi:hypothetical protein
MGDQELIAALKAHYPISVQKVWVAKQPGSVEEVVSFLRQMDEIETKDQGNRMERGHPPSLIRAITGETDIRTGAVTRIRRGTIRSEECNTGDVIIGIIRHLGAHSSITGETTMPHRYSTETNGEILGRGTT